MNETEIRRTEITVETHSVTTIRRRGGKTDTAFCENCGENVQILTPANAALIFRVEAESIEALGYSNQIHAMSDRAICAVSLADHFRRQIRFVED